MYANRSRRCNAFAESACPSVLGQSRFLYITESPCLCLCNFHYCSMTVFGSYRANKGNQTNSPKRMPQLITCMAMPSGNFTKFQRTWILLNLSDFVYSRETFLSSPILQHVEMIWNGPLSPSLGSTKTPASPCSARYVCAAQTFSLSAVCHSI